MMEVLAPVGLVGARVFFGWAKNSLADGKIQKAELQKLGICVARITALAVFAYWGLDGIVDAGEATGLAGLIDILRNDVLEPVFKKG